LALVARVQRHLLALEELQALIVYFQPLPLAVAAAVVALMLNLG
jgi:hypothetical protein